MNLICLRVCDMPLEIQADVRALCMVANQNGGMIRLKNALVSYDPSTNALIVHSSPRNLNAVRFQLEEPKPGYRWN